MSNKDFSYLYENWDDTVRRSKLFLSNPVFIKGLALAPLTIAATTLNNGIILCIAVFFLLTPTRVITSLITRKMSVPFKTFFYPFVSAIIFAFVYFFMYKLLGSKVMVLGIYLPILVVDPIIVKNFEKTRKESVLYSIINGLRNTGGFILACLIISATRELIGLGSLYGVQILDTPLLPMAQNSFGGFLTIALYCALWSSMVAKYKYKVEVEAVHNERVNKLNR